MLSYRLTFGILCQDAGVVSRERISLLETRIMCAPSLPNLKPSWYKLKTLPYKQPVAARPICPMAHPRADFGKDVTSVAAEDLHHVRSHFLILGTPLRPYGIAYSRTYGLFT